MLTEAEKLFRQLKTPNDIKFEQKSCRSCEYNEQTMAKDPCFDCGLQFKNWLWDGQSDFVTIGRASSNTFLQRGRNQPFGHVPRTQGKKK